MNEEMISKQIPYLIIESKSLQSMGCFVNVATKMKRIIEIAMGIPLGFKTMIAISSYIFGV